MSAEGGTKAILAAAAANLSIAVMKFLGWALTGASSMLAEAIHSVADTGNQVLLLIGGKRAKRPADDEHPFGYGRERYLSAFLVSIVLFSVGGVFALYEAYHKFEESQHSDGHGLGQWWWVPVAILAAAIIAESLSLRQAIIESNHVRGKRSWTQFVKTSKAPELPVILLEDIAALLGLIFALLGVGLTLLTGNPIWDVVGTALIGILLVVVAILLAIETHSLLLGESATKEMRADIRGAIQESPGVERLIHCRTLHVGPERLLVVAKIAVSPNASARDVASLIDDTELRIRAAAPMVTDLYLEPDIYREPK